MEAKKPKMGKKPRGRRYIAIREGRSGHRRISVRNYVPIPATRASGRSFFDDTGKLRNEPGRHRLRYGNLEASMPCVRAPCYFYHIGMRTATALAGASDTVLAYIREWARSFSGDSGASVTMAPCGHVTCGRALRVYSRGGVGYVVSHYAYSPSGRTRRVLLAEPKKILQHLYGSAQISSGPKIPRKFGVINHREASPPDAPPEVLPATSVVYQGGCDACFTGKINPLAARRGEVFPLLGNRILCREGQARG